MDRALLARVEKQAWFHRYPRGLPIGLLILSLLIAIVAAMAIEHADSEARRQRLDASASELASALQRRASENIAYLVAGSSILSMRGTDAEDDFGNYIDSIDAGLRERGAIAMGWARWVRRSDLARFEASQRAKLGRDFAVYPKPAPTAEFVVPVTILTKNPPSSASLGYDIYSEPQRHAAIDAARLSRRPFASGKLFLKRDAANPSIAAFAIFVPVYDRRTPGQPLLGFVSSGFRAQEFLESASRLIGGRDFDVAIYDQQQGPDHLLTSSSRDAGTGSTLVKTVSIAGRNWVLVVSDKQAGWISVLSQVVLLFGLIVGSILMALGLLVTRRAAQDRKVLEWLTAQAQIRTSLARELNHRVKNTLANVLSIVSLTRRRATTVDEFADGLAGRLRALSATHDLLLQREWRDAPVGEIVRSELAPYMQDDDHHVTLDGPDIEVAPNDALSLGLALHELVTNAAKYGALSELGGNVQIHWSVEPGRHVAVDWRESGGPLVTEPGRRGFGMDLIERIVANELRQEVKVEFKPGGVECRILIPLRDRTAFAIRAEQRGESA